VTRAPLIEPADYNDDQRRLRTTILEGPRKPNAAALVDDHSHLIGPFGVMLLNPPLGDRLQAIGLESQSGSCLPALERELAITMISAARGSQVEVRAHSKRLLALNISEPQVAALVAGESVGGLAPSVQVLLTLTRYIVSHKPVPDDCFDQFVAHYSLRAVFDLIVLLGYYDLLASIFSVFQIKA
jgi:4-carboxymuconolactone decarboxylase